MIVMSGYTLNFVSSVVTSILQLLNKLITGCWSNSLNLKLFENQEPDLLGEQSSRMMVGDGFVFLVT